MEIIGLLILLVALASAAPGQPHWTGLKPEPEPGPLPPQPQPQPQPQPSVTPHGGGPSPGPSPKPTPAPAVHVIPASTATPAWPAAVPKDLPPFPTGWEPDTPVPAAEVARAKALIPELWKSGKPGATKLEKTGAKWVTYLAFRPKAGMKGVAAYRLKAGAPGATVQT